MNTQQWVKQNISHVLWNSAAYESNILKHFHKYVDYGYCNHSFIHLEQAHRPVFGSFSGWFNKTRIQGKSYAWINVFVFVNFYETFSHDAV